MSKGSGKKKKQKKKNRKKDELKLPVFLFFLKTIALSRSPQQMIDLFSVKYIYVILWLDKIWFDTCGIFFSC